MTAQVSDGFVYNEKSYGISAIEDVELFSKHFNIKSFGLKPTSPDTACWRGYVAEFAIKNSMLVLNTLETNNGNDKNNIIPEINGRTPKIDKPEGLVDGRLDYRKLMYTDIDFPILYTGGILITDGFLMEYYVHMGFQSPFAYETVIELIFKEGKHIATNDLSEVAAKKRAKTTPDEEKSEDWENLPQWIEDRFDLSYSKRWET